MQQKQRTLLSFGSRRPHVHVLKCSYIRCSRAVSRGHECRRRHHHGRRRCSSCKREGGRAATRSTDCELCNAPASAKDRSPPTTTCELAVLMPNAPLAVATCRRRPAALDQPSRLLMRPLARPSACKARARLQTSTNLPTATFVKMWAARDRRQSSRVGQDGDSTENAAAMRNTTRAKSSSARSKK